MRLLVILTLVTAVTAGKLTVGNSALDAEWEKYLERYQKSYSKHAEEEAIRRLIWESNYQKVHKHNLEVTQGKKSFTLEMNQYADMTTEEFRAKMNGYKPGKPRPKKPFLLQKVLVDDDVDWRDKGIVTPVKNQGQCGSCWAFSTTGSVEGQHAKATGQLVSLSEQNLVDCSTSNQGCGGGLMDLAFQYIIQNGGIDTEDSYPYTGTAGDCAYDPNNIGATISSYQDVPGGDEDALKQAVGTIGPVSVAIDASQESFQLYSGGVYDEESCSTDQLDHGVLAVGYGTCDEGDYWIVKNSWGDGWGENGYIRMSRNKNNQCGIASTASYPQV